MAISRSMRHLAIFVATVVTKDDTIEPTFRTAFHSASAINSNVNDAVCRFFAPAQRVDVQGSGRPQFN